MQKILNFIWQWLFTIVTAIAILYLTLVPKPLPDNDIQFWEHTDKIVHAIMFGGLYFAFYLDYTRKFGKNKWKATTTWLAIIVVALMGGFIEIAQYAMDMGRGGDVCDFIADTIGVFLSAMVSPCIVKKLLR